MALIAVAGITAALLMVNGTRSERMDLPDFFARSQLATIHTATLVYCEDEPIPGHIAFVGKVYDSNSPKIRDILASRQFTVNPLAVGRRIDEVPSRRWIVEKVDDGRRWRVDAKGKITPSMPD